MLNRPLNRIKPRLPITKMRTHTISAPTATHWRKATCAELECDHHLRGWTINTAGLPDGDVYLAKNSGRRFIVTHDEQGAEVLNFVAGQPCFRASEHRKRLDREPWFSARAGDWRGNPEGRLAQPLVFSGADAWKDSVATLLDKFRD